jgi:hypothetical protein
MHRGRLLAATALTFALLTGTSACGGGGGDDDKKAEDGQEATEFGDLKPEDVIASPAEVAEGFRELDRYVAEVIAKLGVDDGATAETQERLLTIWESILGAVKKNDEAAYLRMNSALQFLMTVKDPAEKAKAEDAAVNVQKTGEDYLKRFPATSSAAPQSTASPTSSAEPGGADSDSDTDAPVGY